MQVGVLTGLAAEARLVRGVFRTGTAEPIVVRTGSDPLRARREAERLVASGVVALVSFGLAGGLDPRLEAGDLVFADRVITPEGETLMADAGWLAAVHRRLVSPGVRAFIGPIAGTDAILATVGDKQRLAAASGALAADMESAATAEVAAGAGLPFLVIRAVSDCVRRSLPSVARVPLRANGGVHFGGVAQTLASRPGEWPAVARLAIDTRAALGALRGVVRSGALLPPG